MAIIDPASGKGILGDFALVTSSPHASAAAAYSTWAGEMGVSDTTSISAIDGDDSNFLLDLGFSVPYGSTATTKIYFVSEGEIGLFTQAIPGVLSFASSASLSKDDATVSRAFINNASPYQAVLLVCKSITTDCRSENGKWQKATNAAILYYKVRRYNDQTQSLEVAIKFTPGKIEYVITIGNATNAKLLAFGFNGSTTPSYGTDISGVLSGTKHYQTAAAKSISGTVRDGSGNPAARTLRIYRRDTGALVAETTSDGTTGAYTKDLAFMTEEMQVICLDDASGIVENDLILRTFPA